MGCFYSKSVRCLRCNRRGNNLVYADNICDKCIQIQQVTDYGRRLAALRDESTSVISNTSQVARPPVWEHGPGPSTQTLQIPEVPRRTALTGPFRYSIVSKKTVVVRGKKSIHCPSSARPLFGEFKCSACKHSWSSRRSWRGMYQKCQKCGVHVYPHLQRELRKSDMSSSDNPHPEHLCEKCIQLGSYCGTYGRNVTKRRI